MSAERNKKERKRPTFVCDSTPRTPGYYRELLLQRGGFAGGFLGLLLGLNLGLALPIVIGNFWLVAVTPAAMCLFGSVIGVTAAHIEIRDRRRDLFRPSLGSRS
jgi:hypothetical protein